MFPQWRELLTSLAAGRRIAAEIQTLLAADNYEAAASTLDENRPGILPKRIRDAFDREMAGGAIRTGPLSYLPFLATGPVITTNFDRVLEQVFAAAGRPFHTVISGPLDYATVSAVHRNEHALLKIHGDCRDPTFRVFTVDEYEGAYGDMPTKRARTHSAGPYRHHAWRSHEPAAAVSGLQSGARPDRERPAVDPPAAAGTDPLCRDGRRSLSWPLGGAREASGWARCALPLVRAWSIPRDRSPPARSTGAGCHALLGPSLPPAVAVAVAVGGRCLARHDGGGFGGVAPGPARSRAGSARRRSPADHPRPSRWSVGVLPRCLREPQRRPARQRLL